MGFNNPTQPWYEIERTLSGRAPTDRHRGLPTDGGDSPAWSAHRSAYEPPPDLTARSTGPRSRRRRGPAYAELHCRSNFSFLEGASHPEELVEEAARLELEALALTDRDGFYGVVRQSEAAAAVGVPSVFGADVGLVDQPGPGDEPGRLVVLARGPEGYATLARAVSQGQLAGEKGAPRLTLSTLAELGGQATPGAGRWVVLPGGADGIVSSALVAHGPAVARRHLEELVGAFGDDQARVEVWDHGDPIDAARNDALVELALGTGVEVVATNDVHYATPARRRLASALAAVRERRGLDDHEPWAAAGGSAHLRSAGEQARRFTRFPGVVEGAVALGRELAFDLRLVAPELPPFPCPADEHGRPRSEMDYLRHLVEHGGARRYGRRPVGGLPPGPGTRWTTSWPSSRPWASPATSWWSGTSSASAESRTSTARAGARPPTRRSASPSASPQPMR
ncbi:hypothetical protein BH24ACT4_BH24ACT4_02500 [soil metagenome]